MTGLDASPSRGRATLALLSAPPGADSSAPTFDELIAAAHAQGPLAEQPAVRRLLTHRERFRSAMSEVRAIVDGLEGQPVPRPQLWLIEGGALTDSPELATGDAV